MHDYRLARDYDIVDAYNKTIAELGEKARSLSRMEIFALVAQHPAKQFYVSYSEAKKNVSLLLRNIPLCVTTPLRQQLYEDIAILTLDEMKKHPGVKALDFVCDIVDGAAPCFYLSPGMIEQRYNETIKRMQNENRKKTLRCA